jgi:hypothetical protein
MAALTDTNDIIELQLDSVIVPAANSLRARNSYRSEDVDKEDDEDDDDDDNSDSDSASVYRESLPPPTSRSTITSKSSSQLAATNQSTATHNPSATTGKTGARKRGRKPAPAASRSAREQARKTNHSRIEKRRREKINDALATLRQIVPMGVAQSLAATPGDDASTVPSPALSAVGSGGGGKKRGEKEFKLEVLERTVIFVKYLTERVTELEKQLDLVRFAYSRA